jgi:hypothetical protein
LAISATHTAKLNGLVFEEQLFVFQQILFAFFIGKGGKVLSIFACVDELALRL